MNDMLAAYFLLDHFAGRRRPEPQRDGPPRREEESRWARILAWHRRTR